MSDRELLEKAAKAVGVEVFFNELGFCQINSNHISAGPKFWNPLLDDGDALRLAVKLNLDIRYESYDAGVAAIVGAAWDDAPEAVHEIFERDGPRAVRRAIVRAAAAIADSKGG